MKSKRQTGLDNKFIQFRVYKFSLKIIRYST